jgi:4-hydroxy-tetrahydrodipicolinate synthase
MPGSRQPGFGSGAQAAESSARYRSSLDRTATCVLVCRVPSQGDLHGVFPYLVTPVDDKGRVRTDTVDRLVRHLIAAGVHGLTPFGSTGEFAYVDAAQRRAMIAATVSAADGRVPVVVGVGATATAEAVRQAEEAERLGADGLLVILPVYFPLTEAAAADYYRAVAGASGLPIVLYTNPRFSEFDLTPALLDRLVELPTVRYVKDASTNTGRVLSLITRFGDRLKVFAASSHVPTLIMLLGGVGWMAGPACVVPRQSVRLYDLCRAGQWQAAMDLQHGLWEINTLFQKYSLAACIKAGLEIQGFDVGDPIPPQRRLDEAARREIAAALARAERFEPVPRR